jgi:hypothetical protein
MLPAATAEHHGDPDRPAITTRPIGVPVCAHDHPPYGRSAPIRPAPPRGAGGSPGTERLGHSALCGPVISMSIMRSGARFW